MAMTRTEFEARLPELRKQMMGWARALVRGGDAEDLVQEALLRVLGTLDRIEADDAAPWAFGILRNVMRSEWTRRGRAREVSLVNDEGEAFDVPVEAGQEVWCEAQEALRVIAALPAERQSLFIEVALFGNSLEEAAEARGIPIGTVRSRLYRTWDAVRAAAKGRGLPKSWAA
jgi:RNA polymerase sigma-70 factor (ECF subfamily)